MVGSGFQCAGCGEWNETNVDQSGGRRQTYVEDCQICCKPNVLEVGWDQQLLQFLIHAQLE
jgi:Cysteine-rich CPXCG